MGTAENWLYLVDGDAEVVGATAKGVTVRLTGKFWGSRSWAFKCVEELFAKEMPGVYTSIYRVYIHL